MRYTKLPKWWYIKNENQEIRNWFAKEYNVPEIVDWHHTYIGYDESHNYNGVHGFPDPDSFKHEGVQLSFEEFKQLVLNKEIFYEIY